MDTLRVSSQIRGFLIDETKIKHLADRILKSLGLNGFELSVRLVDTRVMRRLNKKHRGLDLSTDVLSFAQMTWVKPVTAKGKATKHRRRLIPEALGDIVISVPDAARNAKNLGQELSRELCFLLVHGILHLAGHDHERPLDERKMLREQRKLMGLLEPKAMKPLWTGTARVRRAKVVEAH